MRKKTAVNFTIDDHLITKLEREPNKSALINRLLEKHYTIPDNMSAAEKLRALAIMDAQDKYWAELQEIEKRFEAGDYD